MTRQTRICSAIRQKRLVSFKYAGTTRVVEPHLLGLDDSGDLTLSAYQIIGKTGSGWRDFHVAKMQLMRVRTTTFPAARPGYNPQDTTLKTILCALVATSDAPEKPRKPRKRKPQRPKPGKKAPVATTEKPKNPRKPKRR